jgi:hypothetical protein
MSDHGVSQKNKNKNCDVSNQTTTQTDIPILAFHVCEGLKE